MTALSRAVAALLMMNILVWAQAEIPNTSEQIDPKTYACGEYIDLVDQEDPRADVRTVWAHGYHSALQGVDETSAPITFQTVVTFAERLQKICREKPTKLFFVAVKEVQ